MNILEVKFNGEGWTLRPQGSVFPLRVEREKEEIKWYLEQQCQTAGEALVIFYSEDGMEDETVRFSADRETAS